MTWATSSPTVTTVEGAEVDHWTAGLGSASHGAGATDNGARVAVFSASTIVHVPKFTDMA